MVLLHGLTDDMFANLDTAEWSVIRRKNERNRGSVKHLSAFSDHFNLSLSTNEISTLAEQFAHQISPRK
jgi:hypothetical protein